MAVSTTFEGVKMVVNPLFLFYERANYSILRSIILRMGVIFLRTHSQAVKSNKLIFLLLSHNYVYYFDLKKSLDFARIVASWSKVVM